jgi:multidrug resistance efflux pump
MSTANTKNQGVSRPPRTVKPHFRWKLIILLLILLFVGAIAASLSITTELKIQGVGYISTDDEVELRPSVEGAIAKVCFHDGDEVKPGDLLIQLLADVQMASYEEAQSDLKSKTAQLKETMMNLELKKSRREAQIFQSEQELTLAKNRLQRMEVAAQSGGGFSRSELEDTQLKVSVLTSRMSELNLPYEELDQQQLVVIKELISAAQKRVALHKAECDARQIRATMAGHVYFNRFEEGEVVKPEHVLGQIFDTHAWVVKLRVPERYLGRVKIGQNVKIETAAYWAWQHGYLDGTITRMIPVVDTQATGDGVFYIECAIPSPTYELQPGMTATAWINAGKAPLLMTFVY